MTENWPIRLRVEMQAGSREDLLSLLDAQAFRFFGDLPYRLAGDVDVDVEEDVQTVAGKTIMRVWRGMATFETLP